MPEFGNYQSINRMSMDNHPLKDKESFKMISKSRSTRTLSKLRKRQGALSIERDNLKTYEPSYIEEEENNL
jgi:hypothetical protein